MRRATIIRVAAVGMCCAFAACGSDTTGPALTDSARLYWQVRLNHHAVTLSMAAPHNTVRLTATPQTMAGTALTGGTDLRFSVPSLDTSIVVSPDGVVTAHAPTSFDPVVVQVALTVGTVTHTDSLLVRVNETPLPPTLKTFSVQPPAGTRLTAACGITASGILTPTILDGAGTPIPDVLVAYRSSNPTAAAVNPWTGDLITLCVDGSRGLGQAREITLIATTTVYGVSATDSVRVVVTAPRAGVIQWVNFQGGCVPGPLFTTSEILIGVGGVIVWKPLSTYLSPPVNRRGCGPGNVDVAFDDLSGVAAVTDTVQVSTIFGDILVPPSEAAGNIAPFRVAPATNADLGFDGVYVRARRFPKVGTYHFHSTISGESGTITVVDTLP